MAGSRHLVRFAREAAYTVPTPFTGYDEGYGRWTVVDDAAGAVHTGFGICELAAKAEVHAHVHSFEESYFVLDGQGVVTTAEGSFLVTPGNYGLLPVGMAHAIRNEGSGTFRWAEMQGPQPRGHLGEDTYLVPALPSSVPAPVDVRDPRNRRAGNITPENMDVANQSQEMLAVSASMRTALLVYSGITVKMMVDTDLGAQLTTMFMVQYGPDGTAGPHDHPFEETYLILEGRVDATFDGKLYRLEAGDVAWAGVGCVHGFANAGTGPVRWLETQAPQPPARHSYRFQRDWDYLADVLSCEGDDHVHERGDHV